MNEENTPESKSEEAVRLDKLAQIQKQGIDPYPAQSKRTHTITEVVDSFESLEKEGTEVTIVGRIRSIRAHGGSTFAHIEDGAGAIQVYLKQDDLGDAYEQFDKLFDVADFIQVSGTAFTTKRGEPSLHVTTFSLLSKALLPLPDKHHGLKDEEDRYRKRYLDILSDPETKEMFIKKSKFWNAVRSFLIEKGFLEVETPVLETLSGGADARPFITHHNALDIDVYLRISVGELWQKRLMAAGYEKTFEIGRVFRNEGMSPEHLQDYTAMEFYWAYSDWNDGMTLVEELVKHAAQEAFGTLKFDIKGEEVDLGQPWARYDYREEILNRTGVDIDTANLKELAAKFKELGIEDEAENLSRAIDTLWKYCRKQITGPGYLVYLPKFIAPLAKESKDRPGYVELYQLILGGSEQCKGYSELNDPVDQEERFVEQQKMRDAGDDEAQMHDHDFVEMLKHGMPPTTGLGFSERLFSFLVGKPVRETQIFPLMRPKNTNQNASDDMNEPAEHLIVDRQILDQFPNLHLGVVFVEGINNKAEAQPIMDLIEKEQTRIKKEFTSDELANHPTIQAWRDAYSSFGADEFKSSIENLYMMILEGNGLRNINPLVDIYNYISIKHMLPAGGDNTDALNGDIHLTYATGSELFTPLNAKKVEKVSAGEIVYKDNSDVLCRRWNWRECNKSKMSSKTKNALLIFEDLTHDDPAKLDTILSECKQLIEESLGGTVKTGTVNAEQNVFDLK